jgi:cysteinyl-tRNA synthetase, unknown class
MQRVRRIRTLFGCLALIAMAPATVMAQQPAAAPGSVAQAPAKAPAAQPTLAPPQAARTNVLLGAKSWAYQLTNLGEAQRKRIADSAYDLVVVDYGWEKVAGGQETPLTREEVAAMQRKPDGSKRLIIAYLSIGETENNRYYWKPEWDKKRPAWMGPESKEWKGNYLVKYWEPVWQNIIFGTPDSYVDRILAGGYDGFYIDRGDAYYRFGDTKQARDQMETFMVRLIRYIRSKQPNSGILVQNAEELLDRPAYLDAIDGIAKEDLLYGITHREELNKKTDIDYSDAQLKLAQKAGKAIFVVEYLRQTANIDRTKTFMKERNYVLYYGPRGLFEIVDPNAPIPAAVAADPRAKPEPGKVRKAIERVKDKVRR